MPEKGASVSIRHSSSYTRSGVVAGCWLMLHTVGGDTDGQFQNAFRTGNRRFQKNALPSTTRLSISPYINVETVLSIQFKISLSSSQFLPTRVRGAGPTKGNGHTAPTHRCCSQTTSQTRKTQQS